MENLKRIHLQDVSMTSEQAIAIIEVFSEVPTLAHINMLGNAELEKLADAKTEEAQVKNYYALRPCEVTSLWYCQLPWPPPTAN